MELLQKIKKIEQEGRPFVAYRKPNENKVILIAQDTDELFVFDDFSVSGYVFAPFDNNEDAYFLKPDFVCKEDFTPSVVIDAKAVNNDSIVDKEEHIAKVKQAVETINGTDISKIVISRKEEVFSSELDTAVLFENLLNTYSNAYVYVWYHPKVGKWMGATPETLLTVSKNVFKTMSLAGTQPYLGTLDPKWGTKEIEEQQMVSDFIKSNLEHKVDSLEFYNVETVKAGNLLHLKTEISGRLKNSQDLEVLVQLLHPTPAVCGLPKNESKAYIIENEGYHRSFYTGYLGVLNMFEETSLFVNLRCFSISTNKVSLYVGGGITSSSVPENEWLETVAKSKTIKNILF